MAKTAHLLAKSNLAALAISVSACSFWQTGKTLDTPVTEAPNERGHAPSEAARSSTTSTYAQTPNRDVGFSATSVSPFTIHPGQLTQHPLPDSLTIQGEYLSTYLVTRQQVGLREGPGMDFPIQGDWLPLQAKFIGFDKVGPWQRVASLDGALKGWVHEAALTEAPMRGPLKLSSALFPRVYARQDIPAVTEAIDLGKVPASIPKGSEGTMLREYRTRRLVLFSEHMTAVWIDKNFMD